MLRMVTNAFASRLYEVTVVSSEGPSMASHLVYDSNMSRIPVRNPPPYLSHDEILVKSHKNDSEVYTY